MELLMHHSHVTDTEYEIVILSERKSYWVQKRSSLSSSLILTSDCTIVFQLKKTESPKMCFQVLSLPLYFDRYFF